MTMGRVLSIALVCLVGLSGCGPSGPKLVQVTGKVTIDGKTLANKSIMFAPEAGTPGSGSGGLVDKDGNYTLTAVSPGSTKSYPGIAPGSYRVMVMEQMVASATATQTGGDSASAEIFNAGPVKSNFPQIYSTPMSPLKLTVPEAGGTLNVELKSKP